MRRILLTMPLILAACTPSPQKASMSDPKPAPKSPDTPSVKDESTNPMGGSPAEAAGRRTLSTAFVQIGPGGNLTVELKDGRVVVLRDVVMNRKDYCGMQVTGDSKAGKFCGGYADVVKARAR